MKKINVTFCLPAEIQERLYSLVGRRKMSSFVAQAIHKALNEKMEALKQAYAQAEQDPDRKITLEDWNSLEPEDWE